MTSAKRDFFLHDCRYNPCHVTGPKNTVREYFLDSSFPPPTEKKTFEMSSSIKKLLDHAHLGWEKYPWLLRDNLGNRLRFIFLEEQRKTILGGSEEDKNPLGWFSNVMGLWFHHSCCCRMS
ncbi:hypothetical protein TNCT_8331 [Trichonephila clavata]|uniref:Uncharacterized protein n=1 Tax=Trichonephila clavata TaxID=2740835 RepID=A0A8X6I1R6_TRICU|nr:hypothetical protein TNCT_8331 [Trichonephila clavata]